jgi:hypothetical protein
VITLTILRDDEQIDIPVTLGERPSTSAVPSAVEPEDESVNARDAIDIATEAAEAEAVLTGEITERLAAPDAVDGVEVWIVELITENETVTVTIDRATGEVLDLEVSESQ